MNPTHNGFVDINGFKNIQFCPPLPSPSKPLFYKHSDGGDGGDGGDAKKHQLSRVLGCTVMGVFWGNNVPDFLSGPERWTDS